MQKSFLLLFTSLQLASFGFATESSKASSQGIPFVLSKETKVGRPQEPKAPFPYREEEVVFQNTAEDIQLAGTLTLPHSKGPHPAVILVHGSGPFTRDSEMFGHKLFHVWADHLTRQGIAVLRFDKRGAGASTGVHHTSTVENFAADVLAGVELLKKHREINPKQIGLVGHSEGGMTALIAAANSQDIAYAVLMAAPCVNWEELVFAQESAFQRVDGASEEFIAKNRLLREQIFAIIRKEKNQAIAEGQMRSTLTAYLESLSPSERQIAEAYYGPLESQVRLLNSASFRYNFAHDPLIHLTKINIPLLALNGTLDRVVSPEQNLKRLENILQEIGYKDYRTQELPNLNHSFQTCQTGSLKECALIEETTAPDVLNIISSWILEKTSEAKK